jgi:hypothetical protein
MAKTLKQIIHSHIGADADRHTATIRRHALEAGWPKHLANSISVAVTHKGTYRMDYPPHLEDDILRLEYGTQDVPPSPIMRNYFSHIGVAI